MLSRVRQRPAIPIAPCLLLLLMSDSGQLSRLWENAVADRTESLELSSESTLLRIGARNIDGYDAGTGRAKWTVSRDGAEAVSVHRVAGTSKMVIQRNFDRPPTSSGLIEGSSYRLHTLDADNGSLLWDSGRVSGRCLSAEAFPEFDRLFIVFRGDEGEASILVLSLSTGERVWGVELGVIEGLEPASPFDSGAYYTVMGERLFRVDRRERTISVSAHDIRNGDMKWVGYLEGEQEGVVLSAGGDLLFVTGERFFCINPANGVVNWTLDDAWIPVMERTPWLLVRRSDGSRIQLVHRNSGEERWRATPRLAADGPLAISWTAAGVLVGESRGQTSLWGIVDGKRAARESNRYRAPSRNDIQKAFVLSEGILFLQIGARGNELLRVGERGETQWALQCAAPPRSLLRGDGGPPTADLYAFAEGDTDGDPGAVWIVTTADGAAALHRVDLASGTTGEAIQIHTETPVFTADTAGRRLFFVDPAGKLVSAEY